MLRARGHELERAFGWGVARSLFEAPLARRRAERDELLAGPAAPARAMLDAARPPGAPESEAGFAILHALYWLAARLAESGPLLLVGRRRAVGRRAVAALPGLPRRTHSASSRSRCSSARGGRAGRGRAARASWRPTRREVGAAVARPAAVAAAGARAPGGGRRRAVPALLRADRRQPAAGARAARGDRAAGRPGRRRGAGRRRRAGRPLARALDAAPARRALRDAQALARGGRGVRGRRAAAPRGALDRPRRWRRRWPPRTSSRARTCCGPATRSGSPTRWCARRSTAGCRSASAR